MAFAPEAISVVRNMRQEAVGCWAQEAFGKEEATSLYQRGLRLLEEAIETGQACEVSPEHVHKLVDYVYSRPVGVLAQELGGVGTTVLALAEAAGLSADRCEEQEVTRILDKPISHFQQRNKVKNDAGFAAPEVIQ